MTHWNDTLLIGISAIDTQHRKLVNEIDKLMETCEQGKGRAEVGHALSSTLAHTKELFRIEENYQARYAYPGMNAHKRLHSQLVMNLEALSQEFERTGPNIAITGKLNKTLVEWFINHAGAEDKKAGEFLLEAGGS